MKKVLFFVLFLLLLTGQARGAEVPKSLTDALPEAAEDLLG